ncbi:hypothetical protein HK097_008515, partial [Rhizophlyctis rosea]
MSNHNRFFHANGSGSSSTIPTSYLSTLSGARSSMTTGGGAGGASPFAPTNGMLFPPRQVAITTNEDEVVGGGSRESVGRERILKKARRAPAPSGVDLSGLRVQAPQHNQTLVSASQQSPRSPTRPRSSSHSLPSSIPPPSHPPPSARRPITRKQGHTLTSTNLSEFRVSTSATSLLLAPAADENSRRASLQIKRKRSAPELRQTPPREAHDTTRTTTNPGPNKPLTTSRQPPSHQVPSTPPEPKPKPYNSDEIRTYMLKKRKERKNLLQQTIPTTPTPLSAPSASVSTPRPPSPPKQKRYNTDQIRAYMHAKHAREEEEKRKKKEEEEALKRKRREALQG